MPVNKCPHCSCFYHYDNDENPDSKDIRSLTHALVDIGEDGAVNLYLRKDVCVNCGRAELGLSGDLVDGSGWADPSIPIGRHILPQGSHPRYQTTLRKITWKPGLSSATVLKMCSANALN